MRFKKTRHAKLSFCTLSKQCARRPGLLAALDRARVEQMRIFIYTALTTLVASLRAPLELSRSRLANVMMSAASTSSTKTRSRAVLVAGAGSLTGRSVCAALTRTPGVDLAALAPDELFLATNDDGRTLAADATPFKGGSVDALVIATDEAPDAGAVASLVRDAARSGAQHVVFYGRIGKPNDALAVLGDESAAWAAAETACLENCGDATATVLRTGKLKGGPYYRLDVDTMRAQTAAVVDTERSITLAAADPKATQQGFGGSRSAVARLAAVALDSSRTRIVDATTAPGAPGAAPSEESLRASLDALPAAGTAGVAAEISRALDADAAETEPFSPSVLAPWTAAVKPKVVNPLLAPPAVSGPYWGAIALFVWGAWLASLNWSWCNVPFAVDPNSPFHARFEQLDTLCVWDPTTRTGKPSAANDLSLGYATVIKNQIRRVTGDETAPKARANAPKNWDRDTVDSYSDRGAK